MNKKSPLFSLASKVVKKGDEFIAKNGLKKFHLEAAELLAISNFDYHYDYQELVEGYLNQKTLPAQNFPSLEFSDLPLTIARGEHCFIDFYFWRRRPTAIHNHHFAGAFQCLEGNNIDLQYTFKTREKLTKFHAMGELTLVKTSELKTGAIQSIDFQDKFIHQNHHQSDLTVNLCFRSLDVPKSHIANFLFSGLRYEKSPDLLNKVHRLWRFTEMEDFDFKNISFSPEEVLCFLMETYGRSTQNKRFLVLREFLKKKAIKELGIDTDKLISLHDEALDKMLDVYE